MARPGMARTGSIWRRRKNMVKRIAYLGPPGTFTEEAALLYDQTAQLTPFPSIAAVATAVASGMAEE
ncbi:MAG: prephenate dehydratase domain-containing protein, partial [Dehalococcoidia bacterium]